MSKSELSESELSESELSESELSELSEKALRRTALYQPSLLTHHSSLILSVRPALRLCVLCERKIMTGAVISRGYTWPASSRSRAEAQRRKDLASLLLALRKTIGIIGVGVIGIIGEGAAPHGAPSINPSLITNHSSLITALGRLCGFAFFAREKST